MGAAPQDGPPDGRPWRPTKGPIRRWGLPRGAPAGCPVGWQTALTVRACRDLPLCDIIQLHGGRRVHRAGHPPPEHRRRLRRGEGLHHTRGHRRLPHGADQRESPALEGPRGPCGWADRHPWGRPRAPAARRHEAARRCTVHTESTQPQPPGRCDRRAGRPQPPPSPCLALLRDTPCLSKEPSGPRRPAFVSPALCPGGREDRGLLS